MILSLFLDIVFSLLLFKVMSKLYNSSLSFPVVIFSFDFFRGLLTSHIKSF